MRPANPSTPCTHFFACLAAVLVVLSLTGTAAAQVKILAIGDSITQGRLKQAATYEDVASYRYYLWHQLKSSGRDVDFVGGKITFPAPNKPWHNNFDGDHEADWIDRAEHIAGRIQAAVAASTPDIILLHAGSSDLSQGQTTNTTLNDISDTIDNARLAKADVTILVAQIIPFDAGSPFFADVTAFNAGLPAVVANKNTATSPVILVDHHTGWVPSVHASFDGVHPFELGELRMADTWHTALAGIIPVTGAIGPVADFSGAPSSGTAPLNVTFSDLSTGTPTTWIWEFGDGTTSTLQTPSHSYSTPGTYPVHLTVGDAAGLLGMEIKTGYITVSAGAAAPIADFVGTPTTGAATLSVAFTDQSTGGTPTSWLWDFGDTNSSTLQNPNHDYTAPGVYTVKLTATNATGSDMKTRASYITVSGGVGAPSAEFVGSPTSGVAPLTVSFTDQSSGAPTSWLWDFGDSTTSTTQSPNHIYTSAGTYTVVLSATNAGGTDVRTRTDYITVTNPSIVKIMPIGDSITYARKSPPIEYGDIASYRYFLWHLLNSSGRCVDFVGSQQTILAPNKTHYNNFDRDHAAKWFDKAEDIASRIQAEVAAAQPQIILLHAGSSDLSGGSDVPSTINDITNIINNARAAKADVTILVAQLIPFGAGPFFADVTGFNAALPGLVSTMNTATSPVILVDHYTGWDPVVHSSFDDVHPYEIGELRMATTWHSALTSLIPVCDATGPTADFIASPLSGNAPLSVSFTDQSSVSATTWLWEFGDGTTSNLQSPTHIYNTPGSYAVNLTVGDASGKLAMEIKSGYITVNTGGGGSPPSAEFVGAPVSGTAPHSVNFTDQSTGSPTSWAWTFGDGGTSDVQSPNHVYTAPGTYTVVLTATNASGFDVRTRTDYITVTGNQVYKIMPVGDSITSARRPSPATYQDIASYRYFLWHQLKSSGRCVDFVGSKTTSTAPNKSHYNNFDGNHEGVWTDKAENIAARIQAAVAAAQPDIILLHAGSSDLSGSQSKASTIADIGNIIDNARAGKADVTILVAQIIPFGPGPFFVDVAPFNADLPVLVASKTSGTSPVILVDHFSGWDPAVHSSLDSVHPYEIGELQMASTWHAALTSLIPVCGPLGAVADFSAAPTVGSAPETVVFTDLSTGSPTTWLWEFGDGSTSTSQNPSHLYSANGTYAVNLTASNANGSGIEIKSAFVNLSVGGGGPPTADFIGAPLSGDVALNVSFTDQSSGNPTSWAWDFGDGGTSDQESPSHIYNAPGTYSVVLTATNGGGSNAKTRVGYITVSPAAAPTVDFVGSPAFGDAPLSVAFVDQSTDFPETWLWEFGDGGTSDAQSPNHVYNTPGLYTVKLTASNSKGANAKTRTDYITVSPASSPTAEFVGSPTTGPAPLSVAFADQSTGFPDSWLWEFGDGGTSTAQSPNHVYNTPGLYTVKLTATNSKGSNAKTRTDYITVSPSGSPVADFTGSPTTGDAPLSVAFSDQSTGFPDTWLWEFGDGGTSTDQNPNYVYNTPGLYTVKLTATNTIGSNASTRTDYITVSPASSPAADFAGAPTSGDAPLSVAFTDASTGFPDSWLWEFGDGGTSDDQNPNYVYNTPGLYTVKLTATNSKGSNAKTRTDYITVSPASSPTADFTGAPTSGDAPLSVAFTDASTGFPDSWLWEFGDGGTSDDQSPNYVYNTPGLYTVKLTATNAKGSDAKTRVDYITVSPGLTPVADFVGAPTLGDAPLAVAFTDQSTNIPDSWLWEFGDGETSTDQNPNHVYSTPGLYAVKLTATNSKGSNAKTRTDYITVSPTSAPTADFVGTPTSGDAPLSVAFADQSTGFPDTWLWEFGDGETADVQNPNHVYTSPGTFTVKLTATNSKGSDAKTRTDYVTVSPAGAPVAEFVGAPTTGDAPLSVAFTDQSTNAPDTWSWDFGDAGTSSLQNPTHVYNTPGTYTVKLTATNSKGSDTRTRTDYIVVESPIQPTADFSGTPTSGDAPLTVSFTDQSTDYPTSWLWEFGDGATSTTQNSSHIYNAPGTYTVQLTATNSKGSDVSTRTDYVTVSPANQPTADFVGTPTTGDAPLLVTFTDQSTDFPDTWLWEFGDGGSSAAQNPSRVYAAPGLYTVKLTASNSKGSDTKTRTDYILVQANAKLRIMPLGDNITEARHGYATYRYFLWNQLLSSINCPEFVGSMRGTQGKASIGHNGIPKYPNFDQDHEGHWGWRADEIADKAFDFATTSQPDTVVCHIGTNDLHQNETPASTIVDIERIIDELRRANPRITIFLAQIIPFGPPFNIDVVPLNNLMPAMVAAKTTAQSPVILVDHFTGWDPAIHSIDGVHPNETGEQRMAITWYQAMVAHGLHCPAGFSRFGAGCAGSVGVPNLDASAGQRPLIGTSFTLDIGSVPANAPIIGIVGFDNTVWNGVPLPMELTLLGMPGCSLHISYDYTESLTATGAGTLNWTLPIPNVPSLSGIHAYFQVAVGDPGQNPLGVTISNAGDGLLGSK